MRITLVSHASVLIETSDTVLWTDPWLSGTAFNDSWSLLEPAAFDPAWLDRIDYLWISHEHPDHFHVPTLRSLPRAFAERVTVLFQSDPSTKVFDALERFGFTNHRVLAHRAVVPLTTNTSVWCLQVGQMDSALAVLADGQVALDVNDAEMNRADCRLALSDLGHVDVVLNQFSIAGYGGDADRERRLRSMATGVLDNVSSNHRDLAADVTIPIASFVYFSTTENAYVNRFANTPSDVVERLGRDGQQAVVLAPGEGYEVGGRHDNAAALAHYDQLYGRLEDLPLTRPGPQPLAEIQAAFAERIAALRRDFPRPVLAALRPLTVHVPDLDLVVRLEPATTAVHQVAVPAEAADLVVGSQALWFAFAQPFGVQTLGVSARLVVQPRAARTWRRWRILFSMHNAEFSLRPRALVRRDNLQWLASRSRGGLNQLRYQLARMR